MSQCEAWVGGYQRGYGAFDRQGGHRCSRKAVAERAGRHYCRQHDPFEWRPATVLEKRRRTTQAERDAMA